MRSLLLIGIALCIPFNALAYKFEDLMDLSLSQLSQINVSIATGAPKSLTEAPAGTSVITAADLQAIGALSIDDALESVPGLHVSRSNLNYSPRYFFRGVVSSYNPQALLLVNGIPMSHQFFGDRGEHIPNQHSLPIKIVDRIEIIRGPGSALYGADAYAGVINVITKDGSKIEDTEVSVSYGSFSSRRASLTLPLAFYDTKGAFFLNYQETGGDKDVEIHSDRQTLFDNRQLAPPASYAPASPQLQFSFYDARVDLSWENFRFRASWRHAWDVGNGFGTSDSLDPNSQYIYKDGTLDLIWQQNISADLDLFAQVSYLHSFLRSTRPVAIFPPGALAGAFPDGILGEPSLREENARIDTKATYKGIDTHQLTLGTGLLWYDLYKTTVYRNYTFVNGRPVPLPDWQDFSDTPLVFQPEAQRTSYFLFAQDEWQLNKELTLTSGLRFDNYDDIGSATTPRVALVWKTSKTLTTKFIYGEAFRVPAFSELYSQSNSVALGNKDLNPELLDNLEFAIAWQPVNRLSMELNIYRYRISDYIDFVADTGASTFTAQNIGRIKGHGAEWQMRYKVNGSLLWLTHYSQQVTKDRVSGEALGVAPDDKLYMRLQWGLEDWMLTPQLTVIGKRQRQANDPRKSLDGYTSFDMTLRRVWKNGVSLALIGRNLTDEKIIEPSRGPSPGALEPNIPFDLPQQGRSLTAEIEFQL
ncbi:MAG: TonB-dependent receptor [Pseudomonadales bacterium]|nr:TonB-dependent receptor [Pseudomonadales bacterium]